MWLASTLRRQGCSQCRSFRSARLYSAQSALATSLESNTSHQQAERDSDSASSSVVDPVAPSGSEKPSAPTSSTRRRKKSTVKKASGPPPKNILEDNKVEEYLAEIAATKDTVTLTDLNRIRPRRYAEPTTPEYERDYNELLDKLQQSFNKKQLDYFVEALNVPRPRARTKIASAVQIIEKAWGWPSLTEMQKRRRDWSEVETEFFPLNPPQSFLIMGKDGSDLLNLSMEYNVHLMFSSQPLGLKVEGLRGALEQFSKHVASLKEEVVEERLDLPSRNQISSSLLQRISRLSGAFTERIGEKEIRISYKSSNPQASAVAKRLTTQASCNVAIVQPPLVAHVPPGVRSDTPIPMSLFPHTYALYPFLSARAIPWALDAKAAFRLRRVGEWLGIESTENIQKTGGLALGRGNILDLTQESVDVKTSLTDALKTTSSDRTRTITASFGHVLITSGQASLLPPLRGSWPLAKFLRWLKESSARHIFNTSMPAALLSTTPQGRSVRHRLIYQALSPDQESRAEKVIKLEIVISLSREHGTDNGAQEVQVAEEVQQSEEIEPSFQPTCSFGTETTLDMLLPDRPMDIRFSTYDSATLAETDWPKELQNYVNEVTSFLRYSDPKAQQPDTPLLLHFNDEPYLLRSSVNVRQNQGHIAFSPDRGVTTTTESVLDLEANEKTTVCQVTCSDPESDEKWRTFLKGCDYLSSYRIEQSRKTEPKLL
ncbi:hypothetical protein VNI00_005601 [Paramarasmius palmivorus]|uniref:SLS1 C-terminal domain-containing protein n=1 Tax=Paramarasmius palmivorus TaxID=297713 RepID=A0AAW0DFE2_9AGAR